MIITAMLLTLAAEVDMLFRSLYSEEGKQEVYTCFSVDIYRKIACNQSDEF